MGAFTHNQALDYSSASTTNKLVYKTASATLSQSERAVYVTTDGSGDITLTLPEPTSMVFAEISVYFKSKTTDDVIVAGESFSNITLDATDEYTVLKSVGEHWLEVATNHA